ncbi:MAG: nucleoside triphosphate pyrophosphohydrolase [Clostridiales bacterium]|nr:nucleoside triphosphate pyrophosphohydrolase [Clostridiales bacterium]
MHKITVITLGPGAKEHLTLGGLQALQKAKKVILRTARHGSANYLTKLGISFDSLDSLYESSEDFDALSQKSVEILLEMARQSPICFAVADPAADEVVTRLRQKPQAELVILPGVSLDAPLLCAKPVQKPLLVSDAVQLEVHEGQLPVCITELASKALAGECKLKLLEYYDADSAVTFFPPGEGKTRRFIEMKLEDLDRQPRYNHTCAALVFPKDDFEKQRYDVEDLVKLLRHLRAPAGCPWDREQTHQSLSRYLIEEANEAAYAIGQEDWDAVCDELGDVLLQVVFHAVVGEEYGTMNLGDIATAICTKLIKRHPHIFSDEKIATSRDVEKNWDKIKETERGQHLVSQKMRALPTSLPPILRAIKVQEAARKVGFDWDDPRDALKKVHEEAREVLQDYEAGKDTRSELGDLFFAAINTARMMGAYPDEVVTISTDRFISRFEKMEIAINEDQKASKYLTLDEWDVYWNRSKQAE